MRLDVHGVGVRLGGHAILDSISLTVAPGTVMGILGPNGSGKSTLLRTVYRAQRPTTGSVSVGGDDVWAMHPRGAARRIAVVPQESLTDFDLRVLDVVLMGLIPVKRAFSRDTVEDRLLALDMLDRTGAAGLAGREVATLSGGERQRVLLARALVQRAPVLVLDEPTNHLDIAYQLELLTLVRGLGVTVVTALHDLNLATAFCDLVTVLSGGKVVGAGAPAQAITPELVQSVYRVRAHPMRHPRTGRVVLAFDPPDAVPAPAPRHTAGHLPRHES